MSPTNEKIDIRPWGKFVVHEDEAGYKLKTLTVNPGQRLSYQSHTQRKEIWVVVKGTGFVTLDDVEKPIAYGDIITIEITQKHRVRAAAETELVFIEVQTGTYFGEDDIIR